LILLREFIRLWRDLRDIRPDIIHAHYGTMTAFVGATISLISRVPLIITFRGSDLNKTAQTGFLRGLLGRILSQLSTLRARAIVCVSGRLLEKLWWKKAKAVVIPVGVNLELFRPMARKRARTLLGWESSSSKVVLFDGNNPTVKRLDIARASITEARRYIPDIRLEALNDTPPEKIVFYLNAADCLLVTSDSEGSPNLVKEALSCNLPVVSVDVGDIAERLNGVFPSTIVERRPEELGKAVAEVVQMNQRSNGRSIISKHLSEETIARKMLAVYCKAVNR